MQKSTEILNLFMVLINCFDLFNIKSYILLLILFSSLTTVRKSARFCLGTSRTWRPTSRTRLPWQRQTAPASWLTGHRRRMRTNWRIASWRTCGPIRSSICPSDSIHHLHMCIPSHIGKWSFMDIFSSYIKCFSWVMLGNFFFKFDLEKITTNKYSWKGILESFLCKSMLKEILVHFCWLAKFGNSPNS